MTNHLHENVLPTPLGQTNQQFEGPQWADFVQSSLAGVALLFLSPVFLVLAIAVKLTSPGPIFYRGARVGKDGRNFFIYKFRTLQDGAEKKIGARLLSDKDQALYTPIGRFLKRSKLDELPQLLNILKGNMNFVGPRPIRPIFLQQLLEEIPHYSERFRVRPGMTGLAQTRGSYFTHPRNKLRYERLYIRHRGLLLDAKIILHTLLKTCHRYLSLGFLLLVLFLFVSFTPAALLSSFYFSVWNIRFNAVHALIALGGVWVLGRQLPSERLSLHRSPLYFPMGVFLLCSLMSALFSVDTTQALRGTAYYLVTGFLIALGIVNSKLAPDFVRRAVKVVAATAVIISAVGLLKLLLVTYLVSAEAALQRIGLQEETPGITATLESPAVLAAYLTLAVPYLLCRLTQAQERGERDFWVAGATITFVGIVLTKTPLGLCALMLTVALYMGKYFRPSHLAGFALATFPFLFLSIFNIGWQFTKTPLSLPLDEWWELLTHSQSTFLLFGYGARTLKESWTAVQAASFLPIPPEGTYAALFLENGLLGGLAMLWIVAATLRCLYRAHQKATDKEIRQILWATFCSIVGFLVSSLGFNAFSDITVQILFWGIIGIGLGVVTHLSGRRKELLIDLKLNH